jgi:ATP-binding cassette subfamily F protein 3
MELASLMKRYTEQQEEIVKTEALIRRFRYKASKAAFAQELIKRLEKMERIEIPENLKKITINFPPPPHSPRVALTLEGLGTSYGAKKVLHGLDLTLDSGERLVVAGPNGAGKTTLLRILAGNDNNFEGSVKFGSGISVGYFSQDAAEALSGSEQVLEFMESNAPMSLIPKIRDMLGAFLFRGDDVYKPVSVLSGGEKSRLALLYMLLKPLNLLILDEPTNHLDLHSKDVLLETLNQFKGTIIFVSHDRAFMEALSTKTLELSPVADASSRARLFYGNYAYYLEKIGSGEWGVGSGAKQKSDEQITGNREQGTGNSGRGDNKTSGSNGSDVQKSAMEHRAQNKQRQAEIRRLQRQEAELLNAIDGLENEKSRLEAELSLPAVYSNGEKARAVKQKLDECTDALKTKTAEWEAVAALLTKEE